MKPLNSVFLAAASGLAALALSACSNVERSRATDNPDVPGRVLAAQVCANCHGLTGESTSPIFPKLAGQRKEYLVEQLADFKSHARANARSAEYMWGYTRLSAKQMDELADYFSAQGPMRGQPEISPDQSRGEDIYRNGIPDKGVAQCVACHGAAGEGIGSFPRLAGQHASYLLEQLKVYQTSDQRPRGALMKSVAQGLSDFDALAVARYIESMGGAH